MKSDIQLLFQIYFWSIPLSRQWPKVYDLCHTFLHIVQVKQHTAMQESHPKRVRFKIWYLLPLPTSPIQSCWSNSRMFLHCSLFACGHRKFFKAIDKCNVESDSPLTGTSDSKFCCLLVHRTRQEDFEQKLGAGVENCIADTPWSLQDHLNPCIFNTSESLYF